MDAYRDDLTKTALIKIARFVVALAVLLFLPAWTLAYWQAWLFWVILCAACVLITLDLVRHDPRLVERRLNAGPTAEKERSQQIIQTLTSGLFILLFIIPGFDHHFGWSRVPALISLVANLGVVLGFVIIFFVFKANSFASSIIEVSDAQRVVSTGPYAVVRHPMYAGSLVMLACIPPALGSWWGLLLIIPIVGVLVWRLLDEERFLVRNLPGYAAYCEQTRYRLVPGLW
jgi:protein-S-isoprenylcysteine O-methyltransferase Ste14